MRDRRSRWHIETPSIIQGSVLVMSKTGVGLAMFSMGTELIATASYIRTAQQHWVYILNWWSDPVVAGLFMALQEKIIVCGAGPTVLGMALRFVAGPAATAAGAVALGLHGDVLRLAVMQAALPQSITTFVFAREYGMHADVLSTA